MSSFSIPNALPRGTSRPCEPAGSVLQFHGRICSDHVRIMVESSAIVNDASCNLRHKL